MLGRRGELGGRGCRTSLGDHFWTVLVLGLIWVRLLGLTLGLGSLDLLAGMAVFLSLNYSVSGFEDGSRLPLLLRAGLEGWVRVRFWYPPRPFGFWEVPLEIGFRRKGVELCRCPVLAVYLSPARDFV